MNFANVRLILGREIRDQLRDRRTLFMMLVLPILLYPLLGMSFLQVQQFMHEKPVRVRVVGAREFRDSPPLFELGREKRFARELFNDPQKAKLLELHFARDEHSADAQQALDPHAEARHVVQSGQFDAVLFFPANFSEDLDRFQRGIRRWAAETDPAQRETPPQIPRPEVIYTTANDRSQIARQRLNGVWDRWNERFLETNLKAAGMPPLAARPLELDPSDVAGDTAYRSAALWSKILPVLLLVWALTGAFYPAIDLCAGEKERGTLETLLCSPAERGEIVLGKLLTIMLFSMVTAVLNLASVGVTGWMVFGSFAEFALPPPMAFLWLGVALIAVSALFSALCLALAAFARSTKEGQYYLMPLLLVTMPLAVLPMAPAVELNLGNSLIPVTGLVLLLRSLLEGAYWPALQFLPVVVAVTATACILSIRWAVEQFNSESVLFRESERLDVRLWLRHLVRDRQPTPTVAQSLFCAVLILMVYFVLSCSVSLGTGLDGLFKMVMLPQLVAIVAPTLLMTILLTRSPRQTLLLRRPPWLALPATVLLVAALHPAISALRVAVMRLYPLSAEITEALQHLMPKDISFWNLVLLMAVVPAVCEELAFRGFVLSGFRHLGHRWRAIIYTALLFGLTHAVIQQQIVACLVGVVIGYLAVQTGSILPCMVFHVLHNTLMLAASQITPELLARWPMLRAMVSPAEGGAYVYRWPVVAAGSFLGVLLLLWFSRLPYPKSAEETLQQTIRQKSSEEDEDD